MMEFIDNFHFLRPWYLLLLLIPAFFWFRYFKGAKNQSSWEKVLDKNLLGFMLIKGSSTSRKFISIVILTGSIFAVLALGGPSWKKKPVPSLVPDNPVMILLNLSSDMMEKDLTPNRLTRAKYKISDFLDNVKTAQTGMIVYTNEPFLITPITDDTNLVKNLLGAIDFDIMPVNGDRLDRAIALAVEKFTAAGYGSGSIIIFSPDVGMAFDQAIKQAEYASSQGFDINIISVGKEKNDKLALIANSAKGYYANIQTNDSDIKSITSKMNKNISKELRQSKNLKEDFLDYGYYLVFIPLLGCLLLFRKGIVAIALFLSFASPAHAGFFLNADQEGLKAYNRENFAKAAQEFEDANWKASSYYRAGDYQKAYAEFAKSNDVASLYNQGNALAKGGKIEEAIKKYEEVLKRDPYHADARFNLEYLKKQQKNQEQQQQQKKQDEQDNQDQQQQDRQEQQKSQSGQEEKEQEQEQKQPRPQEEKQQEAEQKQARQDEEDKEYDEEVQARELQYREIPEDPGGLLRAFIKKEYSRNRYKD